MYTYILSADCVTLSADSNLWALFRLLLSADRFLLSAACLSTPFLLLKFQSPALELLDCICFPLIGLGKHSRPCKHNAALELQQRRCALELTPLKCRAFPIYDRSSKSGVHNPTFLTVNEGTSLALLYPLHRLAKTNFCLLRSYDLKQISLLSLFPTFLDPTSHTISSSCQCALELQCIGASTCEEEKSSHCANATERNSSDRKRRERERRENEPTPNCWREGG